MSHRFAKAFARALQALLIVFLFAGTLAAQKRAARAAKPAASPIRHVIMVSVDGLMPDSYVNPDAHGLKVPTLRQLVREGSYSEGVLGVIPTVTYPSHTSMVTGVNPGTHGIQSNHPFDPLLQFPGALRWYTADIRVPTIYQVARKKGLKTALIYWPVSVGAQADAIVQEFWRRDPGSPEDTKLNFAMATPGLLDAVAKEFPNFRTQFLPPRAADEANADIAVHVIETMKPNLLMVHLLDVDHWAHEDGPFAGRVPQTIETADAQIARIIAAAKKAGIWNETVLLVVSDHGHMRTSRRVRPGIWMRERGLVQLDDKNRVVDWKAYLMPSTGSAYLYVKDPNDQETRRALLEILQKAAGKPETGIRQVLTHEQIVAIGGDPDAFLAIEAMDDWAIAGGYTGDLVSPAVEAAEHGYLPERPAMHPSLLVYGPAIGHAKIEGARLIDIAPTIARWLGLQMEKAEGKPLAIPLRRAAR
jgi:predicted AlkP superfamily pyrophosphatase or phosphodiesterase